VRASFKVMDVVVMDAISDRRLPSFAAPGGPAMGRDHAVAMRTAGPYGRNTPRVRVEPSRYDRRLPGGDVNPRTPCVGQWPLTVQG